MSNKDISRFLFQPVKHYTGMRMQQGRVLLDSDYNEGAWHDDEDRRRTLRDLIGPQGTPDTTGFAIGTFGNGVFSALRPGSLGYVPVQFNGGATVNVPGYYIGPGVMYVGGLRVELEQTEFIAFQRDYLQMRAENVPNMFPEGHSSSSSSSSSGSHSSPTSTSSPSTGGFMHFFYLHVWEQCVTAIEDDEILEHALGGPDTSVRVRRMRRVEFAYAEEGEDCGQALSRVLGDKFGQLPTFHPETGELVSNGRLQIQFVQGNSDDTCAPCAPDATGRYLGAENQAIRIMLTTPNTYVWAIDNGAPLYRAALSGVSNSASVVTAQLLTLPKDEEHWPQSHRVVEILPWSAVLENGEKIADDVGVADGHGVFCAAIDYDPDTHTVTLDTSAVAAKLDALVRAWDSKHPAVNDQHPVVNGQGSPHLPGALSEPRHYFLRFWHTTNPSTPVEIPINNGVPLGTTGLLPHFVQPGVPGDFWIAAVRPETPTVIIPTSLQDDAGDAPAGPRNFYAPLGLASGTTAANGSTLTINAVEDCRRPIVPVTDTGCCTVIVGDGVKSFGQYNSIQAAINALPPEGGHVCIRPGTYREEIAVQQRVNVTLSGCGDLTIIESPATVSQPQLILIESGRRATVHSLTIRATGQKAIFVQSMNTPLLYDLTVEAIPSPDLQSADDDPLVHVTSASGVELRALRINAGRRTGLLCENICGLEEIDSTTGLEPARITGITIRGTSVSATAQLPPVGPLAIVRHGQYALKDWHLLAFGQIGLQCEALTLEARNLRIRCKPFSLGAPAMSALDIFRAGPAQVPTVLVSDCELFISDWADSNEENNTFQVPSEHATVVLGFAEMAFENNIVGADPLCWGGIQLRAGTFSVKNNQITGGAGHGITLGSVEWFPQGSQPAPNDAGRREGAGKGQMLANGEVTGDLRSGFIDGVTGVFYFARVEQGGPGKVEIVGNTIQNMGTNGISVLTLLGLPGGQPMFVLTGVSSISNNRIVNNLVTASANVPLAPVLLPIGGSRFGSTPSYNVPLRVLPLGGIVLGGASSPTVSPQTDLALDLEISGNIIQNNGTAKSTLPVCGIFVFAATSATISNNRIANNGPLTKPADVLETGLRAGIAVLLAGAAVGSTQDVYPFLSDTNSPPPSRYTLQVIANTVEQREGRALFVVGTGSMAVEDNFFSSLGFHGSTFSPEALADVYAIGDVVFMHNQGRPWETTDYGGSTPPNTSLPSSGSATYLLGSGSYGLPQRVFFIGVGGHTLFSNNHVAYDWNVQQAKTFEALSYAPVALFSADHVSVNSNQFGFRLVNQTGIPSPPPLPAPPPGSSQAFGGRPVLTHVLLVGYTVSGNANRVSEGLRVCEASIFGIGMALAHLTNNTTTHCVVSQTSVNTPNNASSGNVPLLKPNNTQAGGDGCLDLQSALFGLTDDFLALLFDLR